MDSPRQSETISQPIWRDRHGRILIALSVVFELAWFAVQNIGYQCDSPGYMQYAWALFGYPAPIISLWVRTPGYPIILALGGMVGRHAPFVSFLGVLVIQAAMAAAMPLLVWKILLPYNRRAAFIIALLTIFSLQPYIVSKMIMTEQTFKFFLLLLILLACGAHRSLQPRWWVIGLSATCLFLWLIRPPALPMAVIVFAALAVSRPKQWRLFGTGLAGVAGGLLVYSFIVCLFLPAQGLYHPDRIGRLTDLAMYDLYMEDDAAALDPSRGPARQALHDVLEAFAHERPYDWYNRHPEGYFGGPSKNPEAWVDEVYRKPNLFYYTALKDAVFEMQDLSGDPAIRAKTVELFRRVVWEVYRHEPWRLAAMIFRYTTAMPGFGVEAIVYNEIYSVLAVAKLSPANGPASRKFIADIKTYLEDQPPEVLRIVPPQVFGKDYSHDVDGFINEQLLQAKHPGALFWNIWALIIYMEDPLRTRKLYGAVDREGTYAALGGPWTVYRARARAFESRLEQFFLWPYGADGVANGNPGELYFYNFVQCTKGTPGVEEELLGGMRLFSWIDIEPEHIFKEHVTWIERGTATIWIVTRWACTIIPLLGLLCLWSRYRWPIIVISGLVLYHAVVSCLYSIAQQRYIDQILPAAIVVIGFIAIALLEMRHRLRLFVRLGDRSILPQ